MRAALIIAGQEIRDGLRNRWIVALTLLLAGFSLTLTFLGSAPTGAVGASPLLVTIVSLSSLSIFLLPLIGLMLSFDSIVGEVERGTMLLLLAYPVARWQVLTGKFLGHLAILTFATVVGYGAAGVVAAGEGVTADTWVAFASMVASSVALGGVFLAIGYLISTSVRERATAAGIAIGVWIFFVLVYDMALLGLLVGAGEKVAGGLFHALLLANPTDAYRLLNFTGFDNVAAFSGSIGMLGNAKISLLALALVQLAWISVPLVITGYLFKRKDI
ncbi:MAG: ABC transporter permease [Rhodospirillales bacterium]|nr:ABC transporter permease [Rhodospirillales bacterium]